MSFRAIYKKRSWVPDLNELDYYKLMDNAYAINELINNNMIDIKAMSGNPSAIELIEKSIQNIDINALSLNPAAGHLFKKYDEKYRYFLSEYNVNYRENLNYDESFSAMSYFDDNTSLPTSRKWENTINYASLALNPQGLDHLYKQINVEQITDRNIISNLCWNTRAIDVLEKIEKRNVNLLDFENLTNNPNAVHIIERNMDKIKTDSQWANLSFNINAVHIMRNNFTKINWYAMSQNESNDAIKLLLENTDKIVWNMINENRNPKAIELLRKNPEKVNLYYLSSNPIGIDLLEEYINKGHKVDGLDSDSLSLNNAIFILDTEKMKKQINNKNFDENGNLLESFAEELIQKSLHPDRVKKYLLEFNYDLLEDEYLEDE